MTKAANLAASANATAGSVTATTLQSNSASTPTVFKDSAGTEVGTLCRAWVNFNASTGSAVIRASFNVSSVTRNGTGMFVLNFTNAFSDANYSGVVSFSPNFGTSGSAGASIAATSGLSESAPTTTTFSFVTLVLTSSGSYLDPKYVMCAIFR